MYHIYETRAERAPVFEKEVFFSEEHFFYHFLVVFVHRAGVNNLERVLYFTVYDMFFDDEFEEIIFEDVI